MKHKIYQKIVIHETNEFMQKEEGFMYNVQVWTSTDNENFYYCGVERFCKTIEEVTAWINEFVAYTHQS